MCRTICSLHASHCASWLKLFNHSWPEQILEPDCDLLVKVDPRQLWRLCSGPQCDPNADLICSLYLGLLIAPIGASHPGFGVNGVDFFYYLFLTVLIRAYPYALEELWKSHPIRPTEEVRRWNCCK